MTNQTIKKLNQLNTDFYDASAGNFSDSRKYPWKGWLQLIPHIEKLNNLKPEISILDLGCGNGRFAEFLLKNFNFQINYLGIDSNKKLLEIAKEKTGFKFVQADIVNSLQDNSLNNKLGDKKYDLVVAMGLLHHIPSFKLRIKFIKTLANVLSKNSYLIITFWQFHKSEKLMGKIIRPELINIDKSDLEENDYILDWHWGNTSQRYCHSFSDDEIEKIIKKLDLELVLKFNADGKEDLNKYLLLRK